MNTITDGSTTTSRTILFAGELLVCTSMVAGITILLYFLLGRRPRAIHLVTANVSSFAMYMAPYAIHFLVCWHLLLAFERLILSTNIINLTSRYYVTSKLTLNVTAFVLKNHLFWTRSNYFYRAMLFIGHLVLVATSEAMCYEKYEKTTIYVAMLLLFCLTTLILVRRELYKTDNLFVYFWIGEEVINTLSRSNRFCLNNIISGHMFLY